MQVFIDVNGNSKGTVITTQSDNLTDVHDLIIVKKKARYNLTNKIIKMVAVHESELMGDIFSLDVNNAVEGEISLPITSELTRKDGLLNCQIGIFGENGFLENTARFSIFVKHNLFNSFLDILNEKFDFGIIGQALEKADNFNNELKKINIQEKQLVEKDNARTLNENTRISNENTRISNENTRQKAFYDLLAMAKDSDLKGTIEAEVIAARGNFSNLSLRFANYDDNIKKMNGKIADLLYTAIDIISLINNVNVVELGTTISQVTLAWDLNKDAATQKVNDEVLDNKLRTYTINNSFSKSTTFTLEVTDERGTKSTKQTSVAFLNGVYYGVSGADIKDSSGILNLQNKELSDTRSRKINVNAGQGQYIYYCLPSRLGLCRFIVSGFEGGFNKVNTIDFTNTLGYKEKYDIYKSTNVGLGNTNITIL